MSLVHQHTPTPEGDAIVNYMRRLKRAHPPGERWNYNTGESQLIGILVARAVRMVCRHRNKTNRHRVSRTRIWLSVVALG